MVDPGRLDTDLGESALREQVAVLLLVQGAGDAAGPELHGAGNGLGDVAAADDVRHGEPPARLQHAEGFGEDARLVGGKVDHTVGDDDVDRVVGQRDVLDLATQELDVVDA